MRMARQNTEIAITLFIMRCSLLEKLYPASAHGLRVAIKCIRKWKNWPSLDAGRIKRCRESSALRPRIEAQTFVDSDLFFLFRPAKNTRRGIYTALRGL